MSSENYRYYRLDGLGQLYEADWFHANDDRAAVDLIEKNHPGSKCEVWKGKRLIAKLPRTPSA